MQTTHERIVISVGGSLIVPDQIDTAFLSRFRDLILEKVSEGFTFAITPGGGKTARRYQAAGKDIAGVSKEEADWIGINVNRMHAEFLRILFGNKADPVVVENFSNPVSANYPIILVGAEAPGHSSDVDAVKIGKLLGAKRLVNLSNTDYIYDSDPRTNPEAKKIEKISWAEFRKLIPEEWTPGLSSPFDPVAAHEAEALGLEVTAINGANLDEFKNYLDGKAFIGSVIS